MHILILFKLAFSMHYTLLKINEKVGIGWVKSVPYLHQKSANWAFFMVHFDVLMLPKFVPKGTFRRYFVFKIMYLNLRLV